jgi:hypothetical protein
MGNKKYLDLFLASLNLLVIIGGWLLVHIFKF